MTSWSDFPPAELSANWKPQFSQHGDFLSSSKDHFEHNSGVVASTAQPSFLVNPEVVAGQSQAKSDENDEPHMRGGLDPKDRKMVADQQLPSLNEQEQTKRQQMRDIEIERWLSQEADDTDTDEDIYKPQTTLAVPRVSSRPISRLRQSARSAGVSSGHGFIDPHMIAPRTSSIDPAEGEGIEPVSDIESIHENQLQDGQTYFNIHADTINAGDRDAMLQSRHWHDTPIYPYAINTQSQPLTASAAMERFNHAADNFSTLSRTASWGSRRRRSETSLTDLDSFSDGSFLKRLAINPDAKQSRADQGKLLKESLDQLQILIRKKSDVSKLKRKQSEQDEGTVNMKENVSKLALPSTSTPASPCLVTRTSESPTIIPARNISSDASMVPESSKDNPKSISDIRRPRSRSDLQSGSRPNNLWTSSDRTPVSSLWKTFLESLPLANEYIKLENSDVDVEDDENEDILDDGGKMEFDQAPPTVPTFVGFQEHVRRHYPRMESAYLVDRIAHQQLVRYKCLLGWRVKHQGAIDTRGCASGSQCVAQDTTKSPFRTDQDIRDLRTNHVSITGVKIESGDGDSDDSNWEVPLEPADSPFGVPMPPPTSFPTEFECPFCFRVKKFRKISDWVKHVHEDVQPFTCTFANCREPKSFKRKADWVRHENERHRHLEWWTCDVDDCTHKCYRKDNFLQHLVREHKLPEPNIKTRAAAKKALRGGPGEQVWIRVKNCHHYTTNKPQDEPCKFCGRVLTSWRKLAVHLARHMEHITLPVLELVNQQVIDSNTILSPVGPAPVHIGHIAVPVLKLADQQETDANTIISPVEPLMPYNPYRNNAFSMEYSKARSMTDSAYYSQTPESLSLHVSPHFNSAGQNHGTSIYQQSYCPSSPDQSIIDQPSAGYYNKNSNIHNVNSLSTDRRSAPETYDAPLYPHSLYDDINYFIGPHPKEFDTSPQQLLSVNASGAWTSLPALASPFGAQNEFSINELGDLAAPIPRQKDLERTATKTEQKESNRFTMEYSKQPRVKGEENVIRQIITGSFTMALDKVEEDAKGPFPVIDSKAGLIAKSDKLDQDMNKTASNSINLTTSSDSASSTWRSPSPECSTLPHKTTELPEQKSQSGELDITTMGKASPFSSQGQDGESESAYDTEPESFEDEPQSDCLRSEFNEGQQNLFLQIIKIFWEVYNRKSASIVLEFTKSMTNCAADGTSSNPTTQSNTASSTINSSWAPNSAIPCNKRKRCIDDGDDNNDDECPPGDRNQGPNQPNEYATPVPDDKTSLRFACPFRKHNPQKYNMNHSSWKICATSHFSNVARTKEHLYRRHKAAIQCVRCWIFFKTQDDLNIHLSAINICEVRAGQAHEGLTLDMIARLKSRKKSSMDETEEDRWRKVYGMLFPNEEMPSPFFEPVLDDPAQLYESINLPAEEFMRQQLPQLITGLLEREILDMESDEEIRAAHEQARLRSLFSTLIPRLVTEAIQEASSLYRQQLSGHSSLSNLFPTPSPSSRFGSSQTPMRAASHTASQSNSQPGSDLLSTPRLANPPFHYGPQYIETRVSESDMNIYQTDRGVQIPRAPDSVNGESRESRNSAFSIMQPPAPPANDNRTARLSPDDNHLEHLPMLDCTLPIDWQAELDKFFGENPSGLH